jgi:hypothetical protein
VSGRSRHFNRRRPGYVSCSNPVDAGRSLYNSEPSIEKTQRNSRTRRRNPEIRGAIEDGAPEQAIGVPSNHHATARHHPWRGAAQHGVELPRRSGVTDTRSSTNWGLAGRVSGDVPKSPCATSLNPGLGRTKSLQNRIVCPRRAALRKETRPRLGARASNFGRGCENGVAMRSLADPRLRPIPEKQAPDPDSGRRAPRPRKDGPARR